MQTLRPIPVVLLYSSMLLLNGLAMAQGQSQTGPGGYILNPYSGMYGSMGNVYRPYYRQFHMTPGMSGMSGSGPGSGMSGMSGDGYVVNPYSGMYGSMGNVYHPYYRQFQPSGMSGMSGIDPGSGN